MPWQWAYPCQTRCKHKANYTGDITKNGLADNCVGDQYNVCAGMTIFGLTSTTGTSCIRHIGFHASVDAFLTAQSVSSPLLSDKSLVNVYSLDGALVRTNVPANEATHELERGIYIVGENKVVVE